MCIHTKADNTLWTLIGPSEPQEVPGRRQAGLVQRASEKSSSRKLGFRYSEFPEPPVPPVAPPNPLWSVPRYLPPNTLQPRTVPARYPCIGSTTGGVH